ncbi:hypothetical protein LWI29_020353 [Acer saccharum]|uniref:Ribulose bisphosphate carboxylase small subunit n=1 Tax=Acer saccharum TaxID=4024 RepID=A0AA39VQZ7_ACESA|nr:hypothetical protein LWI29_020353 [Acer saccharum]
MPAPINVCKPAESADNFLKPVTPCEVGEGLPCAPMDWPNPGDNWGWRVGKRISNVGYYSDRFLYLPKRIQRAGASRHFASKLSLERVLKSEFPGADIEDFLPHSVGRSHHHWHIQQMEQHLAKDFTVDWGHCQLEGLLWVWPPIGLKKFKTLLYLPPLNRVQLAKEVESLLRMGWIPCLEFKTDFVYRENHKPLGYYDGRYWTMWKLPMFGCTDAVQVLKELDEAIKAYPNAFDRIIGFDNARQVQCTSFIAYKPPGF